jgi:uncharacterized membrane-anchored protein YhcB (DUF1043 family)
MLRWPFVASALAIVALIIVLLLVSLVQGHKQLRTVQKELGRTNEQVVQDKAATAELEKSVANLKTELDPTRAASATKRRRSNSSRTRQRTSPRPKLTRSTRARLGAAKRQPATTAPQGKIVSMDHNALHSRAGRDKAPPPTWLIIRFKKPPGLLTSMS